MEKQSAGWAQPLVFLLIRIPGLRLASSNGIISERPFFGHTANPVDCLGIYLKKSYVYVRSARPRAVARSLNTGVALAYKCDLSAHFSALRLFATCLIQSRQRARRPIE